MDDWRPIETAPVDGTVVVTGKPGPLGLVMWPLRARFSGEKWEAHMGGDCWSSFDPQPTHWRAA